MSKIKNILGSYRVMILIAAIIISLFAINPTFDSEGVSIRYVKDNSTAKLAGMSTPDSSLKQTQREVITRIDTTQITDLESYIKYMNTISPGQTLQIRTDKDVYSVEVPNSTDIGLKVYSRPTTNIKKGLDISGGTRVLLKPIIPENETADREDFETIKENIEKRLNIYGLSDISVEIRNDKPAILGGQPTYIVVEIAGVDDEEIKSLISNQGEFIAKIGNETVFTGGKGKDISYICRSPQCSGMDPYNPCGAVEGGQACKFYFSITLTEDAAENFAELTADLDEIVEPNSGSKILSEQIEFYLDGALTNSLSINANLKGRASTNIQITGSGFGVTRDEAADDAVKNMKEMQSVLSTGSLPYKLEVVNTDLISPSLGSNFLKNVLMIGIIAIIGVAVVLFIRYRVPAIIVPIMIAITSEIVMLLGLASMINWTLDLAAIAGIIVAVGTGVDDNIIIADEIIRNKGKKATQKLSFAKKLQSAFFVVFSAFATTVVAMLPLLFAGAGLLRGFAITTIAGITLGVFIARPAFAKMLEVLVK